METNHKIAKFKQRRRNFLPTFFIAAFFWALWFLFVFKFAPESSFFLFIFYFLLFTAVFFTSALIAANSRIGLLTASFIILFLIFRYHQIGNPVNLLLLVGIFIALGFYWAKR